MQIVFLSYIYEKHTSKISQYYQSSSYPLPHPNCETKEKEDYVYVIPSIQFHRIFLAQFLFLKLHLFALPPLEKSKIEIGKTS